MIPVRRGSIVRMSGSRSTCRMNSLNDVGPFILFYPLVALVAPRHTMSIPTRGVWTDGVSNPFHVDPESRCKVLVFRRS